MLHVLGNVPAGHQDMVNVDEKEWQVWEDRVHEPLKSLGCVLEAERHAEKLEEEEWCDDSRFGDVVWVHGYLVVPVDEVHLADDPAAM